MPESNGVSAGTAGLQSLSDIVHQRSRLSVLATLYEMQQCDFSSLSEVTGLTDGNLSRHLKVLEDSNLVRVTKVFVGRRPRTLLELTADGIVAFENELTVLRRMIDAAKPARRRRTTTQRPRTAAPRLRDAGT